MESTTQSRKRRFTAPLLSQQSKRRRLSTLPNSNQPLIPFTPHMTKKEASNLKINDMIDHRDNVGRFLLATIINKIGTNCLIHYNEYNEQWNIWSDFKKELYRFAVKHSISSRPASRLIDLKCESMVDINALYAYPGWKYGIIRKFDSNSGQVQIQYQNGKLYWTHLDNSDEIDIFGIKSMVSSTYETQDDIKDDKNVDDLNEKMIEKQKEIEIKNEENKNWEKHKKEIIGKSNVETPGNENKMNSNSNQERKVFIKPLRFKNDEKENKQKSKELKNQNDGDEEWKKYKETFIGKNINKTPGNDQNLNSNQKSSKSGVFRGKQDELIKIDENNNNSMKKRRKSKTKKKESDSTNGKKRRKSSDEMRKRTNNNKEIKTELIDNNTNDGDGDFNKNVFTSYDIIKWLNKIENGRFIHLKYKKLKEMIKERNINIFKIQQINRLVLGLCGIKETEDIECILRNIEKLIERASDNLAIDNYENIPLSYLCPLTFEIMIDPYLTTTSGDSYQKEAIEIYLNKYGKDPISGKITSINDIAENRSLKNVILDWIDKKS